MNYKLKNILLTTAIITSVLTSTTSLVQANENLELEENNRIERTVENEKPTRKKRKTIKRSKDKKKKKENTFAVYDEELREENEMETMQEKAEVIGDLFKASTVTTESLEIANEKLAPVAEFMNTVSSFILGIIFIALAFITIIDFLYIAVPFTRDFLDGGGQGGNMANTRGNNGGMGMNRGFGGPMGMGGMSGGYGQGGGQNQQNVGGGFSAIGRLVSDEALASVIEGQASSQNAMQGRGSMKITVGIYMKKRAFFLIMFGICTVLFTTTVFTDIGIKIGLWLLRLLTGVGA